MNESGYSASAYFNAAVGAYQRGDYVASADYYRSGLELQPEHTSAYVDYAKVCEFLGNWDSALAALDKALFAVPGHEVAKRRQQRILEERGAFEQLADGLYTSEAQEHQHRFTVTLAEGIPAGAGDIACRALSHAYAEFQQTLGVTPSSRITVHLLPATSPARKGWPLWAAGLAQDNSSIAIFLHNPTPNPGLLCALLRHEYTHILVHEITRGRCPHWLDEALAGGLSKPLMQWEKDRVRAAVEGGYALPLEELDIPFTDLPADRVSLAYHQCAVLGAYLVGTFGGDLVQKTLEALRDGESISTAMRATLGSDVADVERRLFTPVPVPAASVERDIQVAE
jgi:tetratricopeptide (TPR) repeat protein